MHINANVYWVSINQINPELQDYCDQISPLEHIHQSCHLATSCRWLINVQIIYYPIMSPLLLQISLHTAGVEYLKYWNQNPIHLGN